MHQANVIQIQIQNLYIIENDICFPEMNKNMYNWILM